ncbi:TPA: murein biosynthesis integral membrane protein MurJ [bacterium]|nr:murein biosynthesis integral membrane protein MurJ [bacterium]
MDNSSEKSICYLLQDVIKFKEYMETRERVTRSAGIVGLGISFSRITGFLRDILIAARFGAGAITDAFFVAFMIPNLLRDLLAEGALSVAFIPVFTEYLTVKGKREAWILASRIINLLIIVTSMIVLIGIVLAPFVLSSLPLDMIKGGDPILAARLLQVMFPFIIFISLAALSMGILNSLGRFGLPSFSSVMLNVAMILSLLLLWSKPSIEGIIGLAIAVLIGGAAQFLIQVPGLVQEKIDYLPTVDIKDEGVKRIGLLMIPRAIGSAAYQINILICRTLAWTISPGWVTSLYYADRLVQLPGALFGVSLTTALFPTLSRQAAAKEMDDLKKSINSGLRLLLFLAIPSSIGLMTLGRHIIAVLFQRHAFAEMATRNTYLALWFYSLGIFSYGGTRLVSSCFYALQDTKTPVMTSILSMGINILFSLLLMKGLEGGGLTLAASISASFNLALLLGILRERIGGFGGKGILTTFFKVLLASVVMAAVSYGVVSFLGSGVKGLLLGIIAGVTVFFTVSKVLKIEEAAFLLKLIKRPKFFEGK